MSRPSEDPEALLRRSLESRRIHSAYLLSGRDDEPRACALRFVRALVCQAPAGGAACEACDTCRRSRPGEEIELDGSGKRGPLYRHVGDHPDLVWVERGAEDTRVRIGQIRAVQSALRLRSHAGGRRAAVIADAEWLNLEAQNALLRLLEEPPQETTLVLVTASPAGLLPTVRSRCQRVVFPSADPDWLGPEAPEPAREWVGRFERIGTAELPELLDWAEPFRTARSTAAPEVQELLAIAGAWLRSRAAEGAARGGVPLRPQLEAFATLQRCRKALAQRNANPQMVAERALLALREASR